MGALQGRTGGTKKRPRLTPIIPNDHQIYRVTIEKMKPPGQSHGMGHLIVRKYNSRLGQRGRKAKISKKVLKRLQKTLMTDAAIGKRFGISRQAVHQLRQKYGLDCIHDKNTKRNNEIKAMYKRGIVGFEIARKVKISVSQVYRIIKAN